MIKGFATKEKTQKYFQQVTIDPSKLKVFDHLQISSFGLSTFAGKADAMVDQQYKKGLIHAALNGVNVFDTAIQYRNMRSERTIQAVIKELRLHGMSREELFICTKGGYIPFEGESYEDYVRENFLDRKIMKAEEIVEDQHCISPRFIQTQIDTSLKNLGVETIDLYYLQNPEEHLKEYPLEQFYDKITELFTLFEKNVEEKKIQRYGISSFYGFRVKKNGLSLEKLIECAIKAGGEGHHFKAIEVPLNLVMLEGLKNQIFSNAAAAGLASFASYPLMQGKVLDLPEKVFENLPSKHSKAMQALEWVLSTPHLTSALCGGFELEYLKENLSLLQQPSFTEEQWLDSSKKLGLSLSKKEEEAITTFKQD